MYNIFNNCCIKIYNNINFFINNLYYKNINYKYSDDNKKDLKDFIVINVNDYNQID